MTREEAISNMSHDEMIDTLKGLVFGTFDRTTVKEREALDMAIQALSQEPCRYWKNGKCNGNTEVCDDAISREAAIEAVKQAIYNHDSAIMRLTELPSVTQKSGKWIDRQFQSKIDGEIRNGWECSECGERFFRYDLVNTDEFIPKYCPNCGAKMERGNKE